VVTVGPPFRSTTVIRPAPLPAPADTAGLGTDAEIASVGESATERDVFIWDGRIVSDGKRTCVEASKPVRMSAVWRQGGLAARFVCREKATVKLALDRQPRRLMMNGKAVQSAFDPQAGMLRIEVPAGETLLEVDRPEFSAEKSGGSLIVKTETDEFRRRLEAARTHDWRVVSFCTTGDLPEGLYDISINADGDDADLWLQINREKIASFEKNPGGVIALRRVRLGGGDWLMVSHRPGVRIAKIEVSPARLARRVAVRLIPAPDLSAPGTVKIEAESFAAQGQGRARVYTHRKFLSGAGLHWTAPGNWLTWAADVPEAGEYELIFKYATHEAGSVKLLKVDGRDVPGESAGIEFPPGEGYGTVPEEWRFGLLCDEAGEPMSLRLTAGRHEIWMQNFRSLLNVDYMLLRRRAGGRRK